MKPRFFATPAEFRTWLERNHATETELLVGFHKRATGTPCMTWPESVDEALCFGWIDAIRRRIDANTYSIRFTRRKPTSIWSAINVRKVEALRAAGKMMPAGERAFAHRKAHKTAVYSFERTEAPVLPPAYARRFRANKAAHAYFEAQPPWYRRTSIHWVISAKKEETRERRLETLIADSAANRWIGPLRRR
jgi:uncharacterized protein YdeI (YjbR/CyaY-like superfamily)